MTDDRTLDLRQAKWTTAAQVYTCCECGALIVTGTLHVTAPPGWTVDRYCEPCGLDRFALAPEDAAELRARMRRAAEGVAELFERGTDR